MLPPETHLELKALARQNLEPMSHFFHYLARFQEPLFTGKKLNHCATAIGVSRALRDELKIKSIKNGVTLGGYVQALIDGYCNSDILE